ncbi:Signal transduction histidine kinase [Alkalispirochaeta americana]|uniref:histidine kinase n=1 Tax=Alkalispirochaeta americana TaxID=159291 RepID=A0A1N6WEK0_9SPIO|nr:ATP-binding protein [Alkalispirochaeta americana]SIQ88452.1 Signal transduction histidine kinase [Alkalispirochaeta americana]
MQERGEFLGNAFQFLRKAYFFQNLSDQLLEEILGACEKQSFSGGSVIFREGEQGDCLFIVMTGSVEVWKNHGSSGENLLAEYGPGRFFGEMALVDSLPRSATAVARASVELLSLSRDIFQGLVERFPRLALAVMRSLSAIVRESNDSFVADLNHRNQELSRAYDQLEKAQQEILHHERLSNLGKMSDMILHDIRNPVAVLKGYASMLEHVADNPDRVRDFARRVSREAERLSHMAGELLDYTRGEVRLDMSVVAPSLVISEAIACGQEYFRTSGVTVETVIEEDVPIVVDFHRMVRALLNLLDNARKACASEGTIQIRVLRQERSVTFEIQDNGVGMAPDVLDRVFEPFFTRSAGGTGLGMVVVKNVVEAHGGALQIRSQEQQGTCVTIILPGTY